MKKSIITEKRIRWGVFILTLIMPYALVGIGIAAGYEILGRLIGILLLMVVMPLLLLYFAVNPRYKSYFKLKCCKGTLPGRIVIGILALFISSVAIDLYKDAVYILNKSIPVTTGNITYANSGSPSEVIFGMQDIVLDNNLEQKDYQKMFDKKQYKAGQRVKIHYLPNSEYILKTEILDE